MNVDQRILLVDDKRANLVALESLLEELDVEILCATSGPEALSLLLKNDVSLVLLDVQMPDMDGYEVAELMRSRKQTGSIPIIFVTAINHEETHVFKGYESGGVEFLSKPIDPFILISKVKVFLELDRQKRLLLLSLQEVQQLKNRNDLLLRSVGEGIVGIDSQGVITFSNPAAEMVLDYEVNELEGLSIGQCVMVTTVDPGDFEWEKSKIYQSCSTGKKHHSDVGVFRTKLNKMIPVEFTATPVSIPDGEFTDVVLIFKDITERKKIEDQLNYMAQYDALTGLGNRNLFNDALESSILRANHSKDSFALMFIDLDRFKQVNDSLGHEAGDSLLKDVTDRLNSCVRNSDVVCRLGGDEFTIILEGQNIFSAAERVSEKVLRFLSIPFSVENQKIYIGASIGIVFYPDMADDANDLVKKADMAMYQAKRDGRNCYKIFESGMKQQVETALDLESKLRRSSEIMDFFLNFQPKVRISDGQITGVEALLRWKPCEDLISPVVFIPLAEETGLIQVIGEWVIDETCRQLKVWNDRYRLPEGFSASINLSVKQLNDDSVVHFLERTLKKYEIPASMVEMEITETVVMEKTDQNLEVLFDIHALGVSIALDDFGTGYSSMSYLTQLPLNVLKIDRSFINDMESVQGAAIVKAVVALAKGLSLKVVAEGVETEAQLIRLKELACDYVQGFYYSKPLPENDLAIRLAQDFPR
ncbi:hypothetical protein A9Q99_24725 [Gammaproteobacteria bacterium 45_16_T64]|nr:hypothetical protein A9Q99_24725 [Gammaproteobacteria bacterium 45_16_T64]